MKKLLTNNLSLKILSLIGAIVLWFLVTNIENPVINRNFDSIPVTITNGSYLESMGLTSTLSEIERVKVNIQGSRSIVDTITAADIVVTADLTQIVNMDSNPVMVPLTATCTKYPNLSTENISTSPSNIAIELETLKSASFVVTPSTGGTTPAKEFEVGEMEAVPEQVTITGPESLVNKIDKVVARVNVSNLSESAVLSGNLDIFDKNQEAFTENQRAYLKMKEIKEDGTVDVNVTLWRVRSGVSIKATAEGTPKGGYQIGEVTAVPAEISVVGTEEALAALAENNNIIEIPSSEVNATNAYEDFTTKVDISEFLPEGLRLATDVSSSVLINTKILPDGSKAFEVPISNITVQNLPETMMVSYTIDSIEVRVKGTASVLSRLQAEDIVGSIDLNEFVVGSHTVPVTITVPNGLELVNAVSVDITIAEKEITNNLVEEQ